MNTSTENNATVVALFDNPQQAETAIQELINHGTDRDDIGVVARSNRGHQSGAAMPGTAAGGIVFGEIGGLLLGLAHLALPGIGPVVAAGPLAITLAGAGAGALGGGIVGAMKDAGVPEEDANLYAEGVSRGATLVTVSTARESVLPIEETLDRHGAVDLDRRAPGGKTYDREFHDHYERHYGVPAGPYHLYAPAYLYGYRMANDQRFRNRDFEQAEPHLRKDYESTYPRSAWHEVKEAVRHGWEKLTGASSQAEHSKKTVN
jgi:uncharacterized membrane protein